MKKQPIKPEPKSNKEQEKIAKSRFSDEAGKTIKGNLKKGGNKGFTNRER